MWNRVSTSPVLAIFLLVLFSTYEIACADQIEIGPRYGLYGGGYTTHTVASLPHVIGTVTVELKCKADLGCDAWDWTDCNTTTDACETDPTLKWVMLTIAGTTIDGDLSYIGVPNTGDPPVPTDVGNPTRRLGPRQL